MQNPLTTVLVGIFLATLTQTTTQAQIIYQDDFARTAPLVGTNPLPTDLPNASWSVHTSTTPTWTTDGASAQLSLGQADAFLPETITNGHVYTLSANLTATAGSWIALGFTDLNNNNWNNDAAYSWMLLRPSSDSSPNGTQYFQGPFVSGGNQAPPGTTGGQGDLYKIVLDTTGTLWTTKFYDNGNLKNSFTYSANPTGTDIPQYVGFGTNGSDSGNTDTVAHFSLIVDGVVPEPSTYALVGLGLALMVMTVRNRRSFRA